MPLWGSECETDVECGSRALAALDGLRGDRSIGHAVLVVPLVVPLVVVVREGRPELLWVVVVSIERAAVDL